MDSQYHQAQAMGQSPFFYYNPDPKSDNRQHGHFSQQPNNVQVPVYPVPQQYVQQLPSTPIYSRPNSSCSQPPMHPQMYNNAYMMNMPPVVSPRPLYHKPTILIQEHTPRLMIESNAQESDMYFYPATPPLSASGSSISSPSSCEILQTPVNPIFFGVEGFQGVKEGCEGEVRSENLAGHDWARCGSPPMTPVFIHPNSLMSNAGPSELLSATSCPSLSPSPSPYPQSEQPDVDFCDPRNLTFTNSQSQNRSPIQSIKATAEFPVLPTLCAGDEEHKYVLGGQHFSKAAETHSTFDFVTPQHHGLPTFDQFSDLDSEDDFVNGLVNFPAIDNTNFLGAKRQRTGSDLLAIEHDSFISDDDFEDFEAFEDTQQFATACLPSPPASGSETEIKKEKRTKRSKKARCEEDSTEFDNLVRSRKYKVPMNAAAGTPPQETKQEAQDDNTAPSQSGSSEANGSGNAMGPGSDAGGTPGAAPVNRRGRKQSLTEDPSKTFICELCNRRFRRQEHLKRHYRSLHTEDKPFKCNECGKQFSRSDNLSQHSRTHGSGSTVYDLAEDGEMGVHGSDQEMNEMGGVLFNMAAQASGSESDADATSGSDTQSRKKRKRTD
ncbi:hypothetical protein B0O99DRAFT_587864 [Bisporella sp. PMI_857]|nr:hypothetical protein B0O99DRAFT_587864 [Bisporella sp. PMI_857]